MANFDIVDAPRRMQRRKSARERREQKARAIARAFQTVASALDNVRHHRGGALRDIGTRWHLHILRPHAKDVPSPNFTYWRTHCKVVLHPCTESDDAAGSVCSENVSMCDSQQLQDDESEQVCSEGEDLESEELVSRSSENSEGAHCKVALSQPSGSIASDRKSEDQVEMQKSIVGDDPKAQLLYRTIYLPDHPHPEDAVGGNDAGCKFSIGDLVRPKFCLAKLDAYECGAVAQVMNIDEGAFPEKIAVCFFDDKGNLKQRLALRFSEHFVKIGDATVFDEHARIPRCTLLKDRGALLVCIAEASVLCNRALCSGESSRGRTAK